MKKLKVRAYESLFDIKARFTPDILNKTDNYLDDALKACKFDLVGFARLDVKSAFDIVIDGKTKYSYGKGYRAFFNTHSCIYVYAILGRTRHVFAGALGD